MTAPDLKVFITSGESERSECSECGEKLGRHAWITLAGEKGALCLPCADLDHLVFLPSGDAALAAASGAFRPGGKAGSAPAPSRFRPPAQPAAPAVS